MTVGTVGAVVINTTTVPGIVSSSINSGITEVAGGHSGNTSRSYSVKLTEGPVATFTTQDFEAIGTAFSGSGLTIIGFADIATLGGTGVSIFEAQRVASGLIAATGTKYTFTNGIIVASVISAQQGALATIQYSIFSSSTDGAAYPVTITTGQALPAAVASTFFTVGPAIANGVTYDHVQSMNVDTGFDVKQFYGSGFVLPVVAFINRALPVMTANMTDTTPASTTLFRGVGTVASSTSLFLRKCTNNGTLTGGSTDISFIMPIGWAKVDSVGLENDSDSDLALMATPVNTTVAAAMTISLVANASAA